MKSKFVHNALRVLMICAGAGAGVALAFLCVQVHRLTTASAALNLGTLVLLYGGMGGLGALLGHLLSPWAVQWWERMMSAAERFMDDLSMAQLAAMMAGLVTGLLVAALLSQVLRFLGDSIFTLAASAMLYLALGATGVSVGRRRTEDFAAMLSHLPLGRERAGRRRNPGAVPKLLDQTVLQDGRLEAVLRSGFLEGEMLTPAFVMDALHEAEQGSDGAKQQLARRALNAVKKLEGSLRVVTPGQESIGQQPIIALAAEQGASLVTNDPALLKAARAAGVTALSLNELACALRMTVAAGDVLSVALTRQGREPEQGVGYLEDGTMLVVEGGSACIGSTVEVTVTSVLQTSAGRMVFARMDEK